MRQGEDAVSFVLIQSGRAQVSHIGDDGVEVLDEVPAGAIVGEIALLRDKPRTATSHRRRTAVRFVGDEKAFAPWPTCRVSVASVCCTLRQRLAAFITPIPVGSRRAPNCCCARCFPATANGPATRSSSPRDPVPASCRPAAPVRP